MNRNLHILLIALTLAGASVSPTWAAASASETLEQGIFNEETAGDLDAAIKIYEKIVSNAEANRPTIANALFRLGMCYTKLGKKAQAKTSFEMLIRDYSEQTEWIVEALQILNPARQKDIKIARYQILIRTQELFDDYNKWILHMVTSRRADSEQKANQARNKLLDELPKLKESDVNLMQFMEPKLEPMHQYMTEALNWYVDRNRAKGNKALSRGSYIADSIDWEISKRIGEAQEQLLAEALQILNPLRQKDIEITRYQTLIRAQKLFDDYYRWILHMVSSWRAESEEQANLAKRELQYVLSKLKESDADLVQFVEPKLIPMHHAMIEALDLYIDKDQHAKASKAVARGSKIADSIDREISKRVGEARERLTKATLKASNPG